MFALATAGNIGSNTTIAGKEVTGAEARLDFLENTLGSQSLS
jgi:hypothetical protein